MKSAVASLALLPLGARPSMAISSVQQSIIVLSDISEETSFPQLIAALDAFTEQNIPVVCAIRLFDEAEKELGSGSKLSQLMKGYLIGGSNVELAPYLPDLARLSPHFQARATFEATQALQRLIGSNLINSVRTVICDEVENPTAPTGARSSGILNILVKPNENSLVQSQTWHTGTVRLLGGQKVSLGSFPHLPKVMNAKSSQRVFYLSAQEFSKYPINEIEIAAKRFCSELSEAELEGILSLEPASDLQLRNNYEFRRHFCCLLVQPPDKDAPLWASFNELRASLTKMGVAFTEVNDPGRGPFDRLRGIWVPSDKAQIQAAQGLTWPQVIPIEIPKGLPDRDQAIRNTRPLGPGVGIVFRSVSDRQTGFDRNGLLNAIELEIHSENSMVQLRRAVGGMDDLIISILPSFLHSQPVRNTFLGLVSQLMNDGITYSLPIDQFVRFRIPKDPISSRRRKVAAAQPGLRLPRRPLKSLEKDRLLEDARVAWRYFTRFTNKKTGLCPATVNAAPGGRLHETVTMWDVGSHINGLVAATQIGLIDQKSFEISVRKILPNIVGRTSQNRRLPQGWIRTDRHKWGNKNFDGSDAGRLLSSLDNLRRFGGFEDQLEEMVASWSLQDIILEGKIHSVINGGLASSYVSHSAHYSALAFRRWGLDVRSPYEVYKEISEVDDQTALLEAVAKIGPIGAEPLLLEAMEMGMSRESAYLADVLFSTQVEEFDDTGRLICVSEGPIDLSPWFTYQGLQLDAETRTWATDTVGKEPEYRTPDFRENYLVVSTKSAFLWGAYQQHEYSDRLLRFVRETSKTENGFSSSTFVKTGRTTELYSDLNTNGVILQALAHQLGVAG
ncbi:DUF3131 domain-containing protein [Roseobacter sp. SK209-2-6]|uniref:DUF3131 domain-containing protein n=1 Tax=Roseobacter sp. SK209-2-6 TaxID=388739 RepID=UPI001E30597B|nr:DUF3131 domain-containing protein [Roseobacter sp. SK209-2-6]